MPLRDHFRPPVERRHSWDELHGGWPMMIVQKLFPQLPAGYVAVPGVHLGAMFEIHVSAYEQNERVATPMPGAGASVAVAPHASLQPTLTLETEWPDQDEYEVRVYDERHGRRLVAAIELISPCNKDRPESRRAFVGKVAALLQSNVCVSLVDVVTIRDFNFYTEVLEFIGGNDPALMSKPPSLYAATMRRRKRPGQRSLLESWFYPMHIGQPLPTLPIWLDVDLRIDLELESSYEETCRFLRIS